MKLNWIYAITLMFSALVGMGCQGGTTEGASSGESSSEPVFDDAGDRLAFRRCVEEIPEIRAGLELGDISSTGCAGIISYAERIADHSDERVQAASSEIIELCGLEVPLAEAETELAEAQTARDADPRAIIVGQCSMANFALGRVNEAFSGHERVVELSGRVETFCN